MTPSGGNMLARLARILVEAYRLESACPDGVGQELLFRTDDEAWFLHRRRAS